MLIFAIFLVLIALTAFITCSIVCAAAIIVNPNMGN